MERMPRHTRILLVQENRYQALLCRRELGASLSNAVVAVYSHPTDALQEFAHIQYDFAIVDTAMRSLPPDEFVSHLRLVDPTLPMVILVEAKEDDSAWFKLDDRVTVVVKEANYHRLLPELIRKRPRLDFGSTTRADKTLDGFSHDIDAIVANLENDINNPLMAILGATELILTGTTPVPPEVAHKIDIVRTSAQRIQDVLASFSRTTRTC